jgi:hypothetical protein
MDVESREPIIHSGFFRLKYSYTIVEQKKLHIEGLAPIAAILLKKIPTDLDDMVTRYTGAGRAQTINFFVSKS